MEGGAMRGMFTAGVVSAKATLAEPEFALQEKDTIPKVTAATKATPKTFFVSFFIILNLQ